jgi:hypothetical protein
MAAERSGASQKAFITGASAVGCARTGGEERWLLHRIGLKVTLLCPFFIPLLNHGSLKKEKGYPLLLGQPLGDFHPFSTIDRMTK